MVGWVPVRALADELNVSVDFLRGLARAGRIEMDRGRVLKDSADELRWLLAAHRVLLDPEEQ